MLGPSGSGKTTVLRMIAGFEEPTAGTVELVGEDVTNLPPNRRDVNTVFQDYALFPHMSVLANVEYGLRVKKVSGAEVRRRAQEALEQVRLGDHATRRPDQLSGGQRQRVALARALVNRPQVLLLDEPLGALDLKLREQMQVELKAIQRDVGITFLFVTHDQEEALTLSDRVAVFNAGRIEQVGTAREVYEQPASGFVAGFVGTSNLLSGRGRPVGAGPRRLVRHPAGEDPPRGAGGSRRGRCRAGTGNHRRGRLRGAGHPLRRRPRRRGASRRPGAERPPQPARGRGPRCTGRPALGRAPRHRDPDPQLNTRHPHPAHPPRRTPCAPPTPSVSAPPSPSRRWP